MAGTRTVKSRTAAPAPSGEPDVAIARAVLPTTSTFRFEAWPTEFRVVTQWFGPRPEFYTKFGLPGHEGIDFTAPLGSKIFAIAAGTVKRVQTTDDGNPYGIHVRIQHGEGYETVYGHFKDAAIKPGDEVTAGQLIGYADSTGNSFGSHLHLTLKHATETLGRYPNHIVDPTPFLQALLDIGKDGAAYVKDVIPDGTEFLAGETFEQRWTVRNTGTTAWGDGYALAYLSGDRLGGPAQAVVPPTDPGGLAEVKVSFQAPAAAGRYRSVWRMLAPAKPSGAPAGRFGERMWVEIRVPEGPAHTTAKELFEAAAPLASGPATVSAPTSSLADLITAFGGMGADEIRALLAGMPLLAGVEVILRGFSENLRACGSNAERDALTGATLNQIIALQERLLGPR